MNERSVGGCNDNADVRRIVVGLDGSPQSLSALEWAAHQAELTGFVVEVVMTWEWPIEYGWAFLPGSDYVPTARPQAILDQAIGVFQKKHPTVTFHPSLIEGHAASALVSASQGAEVLVVGSRGHGAFAGMLLGSVSQHCVAKARCPVLVLHNDAEMVGREVSA